MQKLAAFYFANAKKELSHYGVEKGNEELRSILNNANLYEDEEFEEELNDETNEMDVLDISENDESIDKNNIYLDSILDLNASEFLKDLDEIIGDSDIDLEEKSDNSKIIQEEFNEDWNPNLAVEAYL